MNDTEQLDDSSDIALEQSPAEPARPITTTKYQTQDIVQHPEQDQAIDDGAHGISHETPLASLYRLMVTYPSLRMFCWLADRQFSDNSRPAERFRALRSDHPKLYRTAVWTDWVLSVVIEVLIILALIYIFYKTIIL